MYVMYSYRDGDGEQKVPSLVSKDEDDDILDGRRSFVPSVDVKIRFQLKILGA